MGIHHALYSGVSGLAVNTDGMSVISNNIANANTRGYKTDRAEFEDLLAVNLNENSQLGRGARLRNIQTMFTQGALSNTGAILDLGIQGDGFFMTRNEASEVQESGGQFFTRQGSFRFDKDGFITDVNGAKLQGYMTDKEGALSTRLTDMQIPSGSIPPAATTKVNVAANLDIRAKPVPEEFDVKRPSATSNFNTSVTLFDNWGQGHVATVYFSKSPDQDKNVWKWHAVVDGNEVAGSEGGGVDDRGNPVGVQVAQGEVEFDPDGKPMMKYKDRDGKPTYNDTMEKSDAYEIKFANGAVAQKVQFNFGPAEDENGKYGAQSSTSVASKSTTMFHSQNGYEGGNLKSMKIDLDGTLRGVYTNGLERRLGAVAVASFASNNGLQKVGRNNYIATVKSGEPRIGLPQTGSRGSIYSASLEESNVDLAQQFVDMITTQRGFQANSKSITTTDTLLEEVINLKR